MKALKDNYPIVYIITVAKRYYKVTFAIDTATTYLKTTAI